MCARSRPTLSSLDAYRRTTGWSTPRSERRRLKHYAMEFLLDRQLADGSKQNGVCNDDLKDSALEFLSERKLANCSKQNSVSRTAPWTSSRIGSWSTAPS